VKRLLAKDRNSVGLEAHEQLVAQTAELQKEGEALRDQGKQAAAAKEKLEAELAASVQLVGRLKKAGGNFKAQLATANKELEELRTTAAADQAKAQLASNKDLEAQLAAAKAAADEGEKKAAALGAELEQARTLCSRVR
jgi:chromosome segregation ATPase